MITISLCMIVKNEKDTLGRCLESVKDIVDEIVIVDTGSSDETKEIAGRFTSNIYDFEWIDDFSAARNYSFSKAFRYSKLSIMPLDFHQFLLIANSSGYSLQLQVIFHEPSSSCAFTI